MTDLLSLTAPIFILVAIGFAAVRLGRMPQEHVRALGFFVLNFAMPALIVHAMLSQDMQETFNGSYVAAYAAGSLAAFAAVLLVFRAALRRPLAQSAVAALGGSTSNSGFVGFPLASLALGAPALTAFPLTLLVENILIIPLALVLGEIGLQGGQTLGRVVRNTAARLVRSPLILAIALGAVLSGLGLRLPGPVATAVGMTAAAAVPCALFVVGGTLAGLRAGSVAGEVPWIVVAKLVLHPLAVAAAFMLVGGVPPGLMAAGIIIASAPMITVYPILGARFGQEGMCAAALFATTLASVVTLIVMLVLVLPLAA